MTTMRDALRAAGGRPPSFGTHTPVTWYGRRVGAVVGTLPGQHVPVCSICHAALTERATPRLARGALLTHWDDHHGKDAAA